MPTKRRFLLFLIVLAIMLLIKQAVGQEGEPTIGWDPQYQCFYEPPAEAYGAAACVYGVFVGVLWGLARVMARGRAVRRGFYFTGDLITLNL